MFKVTATNWLLVLGGILFVNNCYFAYAYLENFGSFKLQYPNYTLAVIYACNSAFILAGLFGERKKYSRDLLMLGQVAALSLLLVSVELVIHSYYWKAGMFLSAMNVVVSTYFVVLVFGMMKKIAMTQMNLPLLNYSQFYL